MRAAARAAALGARLGWSRSPGQGWRQISVALAVFIAILAALFSVGLMGAAQGAVVTEMQRRPILDLSEPPQPVPHSLQLSGRADTWEGRQFPVLTYLGDAQSPLPPGLHRLPRPGMVAVSPAVARNAAAVLALGYQIDGGAGTGPGGAIGAEGLVSLSEWLVYATPAEGRTLGEGGALMTVVGFGPEDLSAPQLFFVTDPAMLSPAQALFGSLWLLVIPALLLLVLGVSAYSPAKISRARSLHLLGLTPHQLRMVGASESLSLALIPAITAVTLWLGISGSIAELPMAGLTLVPGSLHLSAGRVTVVTVLVLVLACLVGARGMRTSTKQPARLKVRKQRWLAIVPLIIAMIGMLAACAMGPGEYSVWLILGSLVLATATLPLALPWLVATLGGQVSRLRPAAAWLAGRRLQFSPAAMSRPAVSVGVLLFVLGAGTGMFLKAMNTFQAGEPTGVFETSWRGARAGDIDLIKAKLPGAAVGSVDAAGAVWFESCAELAAGMGGGRCADAADQERLTSQVQDTLGMAGYTVKIGTPQQFGDAATSSGSVVSAAIVVGYDLTLSDVMRAVRDLPAGYTWMVGNDFIAPELVSSWLGGGLAAGVLLLILAALHSFGNRTLLLIEEDLRLLRLGLDAGQVRAVQRWALVTPLLVVIPAATLAAMVFTWSASDVDQAVYSGPTILLEAGAVLVMGLCVVALVDRVQNKPVRRSQERGK